MFDIQFNSTELNKQIQIQLDALSVSLTEKLGRVPLIRIKQKLQLTNHLLFDTLDLQPLAPVDNLLAQYKINFADRGFINLKTHFLLQLEGLEAADYDLDLFLQNFRFAGTVSVSQDLKIKMKIQSLEYKGIGGSLLKSLLGQFEFCVDL